MTELFLFGQPDPSPAPPARSSICDCDHLCRKWNPITGRCESCGSRYVDQRKPPQRQDARPPHIKSGTRCSLLLEDSDGIHFVLVTVGPPQLHDGQWGYPISPNQLPEGDPDEAAPLQDVRGSLLGRLIEPQLLSDIFDCTEADAEAYGPAHPWYYKLGGRVPEPDEIVPDEASIQRCMDRYKKTPDPVVAQAAREEVDNCVRVWTTVRQVGVGALTDFDQKIAYDSHPAAVAGTLALTYTHIRGAKALLAALERKFGL